MVDTLRAARRSTFIHPVKSSKQEETKTQQNELFNNGFQTYPGFEINHKTLELLLNTSLAGATTQSSKEYNLSKDEQSYYILRNEADRDTILNNNNKANPETDNNTFDTLFRKMYGLSKNISPNPNFVADIMHDNSKIVNQTKQFYSQKVNCFINFIELQKAYQSNQSENNEDISKYQAHLKIVKENTDDGQSIKYIIEFMYDESVLYTTSFDRNIKSIYNTDITNDISHNEDKEKNALKFFNDIKSKLEQHNLLCKEPENITNENSSNYSNGIYFAGFEENEIQQFLNQDKAQPNSQKELTKSTINTKSEINNTAIVTAAKTSMTNPVTNILLNQINSSGKPQQGAQPSPEYGFFSKIYAAIRDAWEKFLSLFSKRNDSTNQIPVMITGHNISDNKNEDQQTPNKIDDQKHSLKARESKDDIVKPTKTKSANTLNKNISSESLTYHPQPNSSDSPKSPNRNKTTVNLTANPRIYTSTEVVDANKPEPNQQDISTYLNTANEHLNPQSNIPDISRSEADTIKENSQEAINQNTISGKHDAQVTNQFLVDDINSIEFLSILLQKEPQRILRSFYNKPVAEELKSEIDRYIEAYKVHNLYMSTEGLLPADESLKEKYLITLYHLIINLNEHSDSLPIDQAVKAAKQDERFRKDFELCDKILELNEIKNYFNSVYQLCEDLELLSSPQEFNSLIEYLNNYTEYLIDESNSMLDPAKRETYQVPIVMFTALFTKAICSPTLQLKPHELMPYGLGQNILKITQFHRCFANILDPIYEMAIEHFEFRLLSKQYESELLPLFREYNIKECTLIVEFSNVVMNIAKLIRDHSVKQDHENENAKNEAKEILNNYKNQSYSRIFLPFYDMVISNLPNRPGIEIRNELLG